MVSDEALKKLQEQIAAWPMTQRFVVQQIIEEYRRNREDLRAYEATGLTMAEYIEREALLLRIDCHGTNKFGMLDEDIRAFVKAIPAADVAPVVHGRWIHSRYEDCSEQFELVKCSQCNHEAYAMAFYVRGGNYCPNCGAKMDGGVDDATNGNV